MPDTAQTLLTAPPVPSKVIGGSAATIGDEAVIKCCSPRTQLASSFSGAGRWVALGLLWVALPGIALSQSTSTPPAGPPADRSAQGSTSTTTAPFKISVAKNLVVVRVVVRDSKGQAVGDLTKNDFILLDNGHPQAISTFAVDRVPARSSEPATAAKPETSTSAAPAQPAPAERYVALFFDDVHASLVKLGSLTNLHQTGQAARAFLAADVQPGDRIGLFTASGKPEVDFTGDRARLEQALDTLRPRPLVDADSGCPRLTDYEAYLIVEVQNPTAMADEAVRSNVVINSLNAEGLVPDATAADPISEGAATGPRPRVVSPDVLDRSGRAGPYGSAVQFFHDAAIEHDGVLADFAANTGGQLFHNNNDYRLGLRQLMAPEISYTLAFSPA